MVGNFKYNCTVYNLVITVLNINIVVIRSTINFFSIKVLDVFKLSNINLKYPSNF